MSYFNTSTQTPYERRDEADRILGMLNGSAEEMQPHEQKFIEDIQQGAVSPKQLFWLRDLKDKYL